VHILTLTTLFPNALQPHHAVFVRARMEAYTRQYGHRWTVVAPIPYFPRLPFKVSGRYATLARVPAFEDSRGYPVHHPRYLVTPKVGMRRYGAWMATGVRRLVTRLHAEDPFDVIDGHYVYPDGTAAVRLGAELGIPVVLSARGTDLNLYPRLPGLATLIRSNLDSCRHLICVCEGLRQEALKLGVPDDRVSVIGNGVDADRFRRGERGRARESLGLPRDATVLLSVGHLTERKGFHLLIGACARLGRDDMILIIAGDGSERGPLERLAGSLDLRDRVRFPGAVRNEDLPTYYQAADLFALASSREGWPNVLCEAQACGLPAVATEVWGIPEIIRGESFGVLVRERTTDGLRAGLEDALSRDWDRDLIESVGRSRTWDRVAEELEPIFSRLAS
jgi:glycosyltransferase involved in cell wall biosynthesis